MKKFAALILLLCLVFASGCKEEDLISAPIFISRFNNISKDDIDEKNITAVEENDTLIYSFLLSSGHLVTLRSDSESGKVKQCTVTAENNKNLDEKVFFDVCALVIMAYEKTDRTHAENVLRSFSFKKREMSARDGFFRLDLIVNDAAVFFSIESSRLTDEKVTDKKLYEQTF